MDIPWYVDFFREGFYHRWGPADRFQRAERAGDFIEEALGLPAGARPPRPPGPPRLPDERPRSVGLPAPPGPESGQGGRLKRALASRRYAGHPLAERIRRRHQNPHVVRLPR